MADSLNYVDPRGMMADRYASQYTPLSGNLDQMTVQLGGNAGAMLGNALFGGQSSAMMEQRAINDAIKEADTAEDPDERLNLFAQALRKRGLEGRAQDVESKLIERMKSTADIKAADALAAQRNREVAAKTSAFGQQLIDAGLTPGTPEYVAQMRRYVEKELTPTKSIGDQIAAGLSPLVGAMAKDQAKKAAETGGAAVGKDVAAIQGKEDALTSLKNASKLLKDEKGNYQIYAGFYGPGITTAVKASGGFAGNRQKVVQTEKFLNEVKTTVIPLLAEFGGNDSNEELKFLQGMVGGDQTLEPESIDAILKSAQAKIQRGIKRTQDQQKAILEGQPLPTGLSGQPRPTKRYNPATGRVEVIKE